MATLMERNAVMSGDSEGITHTTRPIVTGTSLLGLVYDGGVAIMADTLASYGSLARFGGAARVRRLGKSTIIAGGGDYSDFQAIHRMLNEIIVNDQTTNDGVQTDCQQFHSYLGRVMYQRRSKMDPLWNEILIAGMVNGQQPFLGTVDLRGRSYTDVHIATGYGQHIALPLLRKAYRPNLTKEEAVAVLEKAMRVLVYRDARAFNRVQVACADATGVTVSDPYELSTEWAFAKAVSEADGAW